MESYFVLTNPAVEVFRGFDSRDFDRGCSFIPDDGYVEEVPTGERWEGPAGVKAEFERWAKGFSDAHNKIHRILMNDDYTVIEGTWCGTHDGDLNLGDKVLPPTGKSLAFPYTTVARCSDGMQLRSRHYYDLGTIMTQLGLAAE